MSDNFEKKKRLLIVEKSMKRFVTMQWNDLRDSILAPRNFSLVDRQLWGQRSRTWRKSKHPLEDNVYQENIHSPRRSKLDDVPVFVKKPVPPPPILPPNDVYSNKSRIIICNPNQDGDWQVQQEEEDQLSSQESNYEEDDYAGVEVVADVHDRELSPHLHQGDTEPPGSRITGLVYGDDVTPLPAPHSGREMDGIDLELWNAVMTPQPPPYLSVEEAERHHDCADERLELYSNDTADYTEVTGYARDDLIVDETTEYTEETEHARDDLLADDVAASSKDVYLEEFNAFYANYDAEAEHMYYREEQEDAENDGYEAYEVEAGNDDYEGEED